MVDPFVFVGQKAQGAHHSQLIIVGRKVRENPADTRERRVS
jgi:hypothetical protein